MKRREFLKTALTATAFPLLPGCFTSRGYVANEKVRLAFVGIGHQGLYDINEFGRFPQLFECVALCDTDMGAKHTLPSIKKFPNVPRFHDFRKMFDAMADKIDAVMVATPDHTHFPIAMHAMKLGKAVYVEKPLAHTFQECELLIKAAKKYGVVTQMGNQGHSTIKYHQFKEYVKTGLIHDVEKVVVHMNNSRRWHKWNGLVSKLPGPDPIPSTLDWKTWLGSKPFHEYANEYMHGEWRAWYDFGSGCMGDWGAHLMDCVHEFLLKGDLPTKVEVVKSKGWNKFVYPLDSTLRFTFPRNDLHDDMKLEWYEGKDNLPQLPVGFVYDTPDGIPKNAANDDSERIKLFPGKEMYQRDGTIWQSMSHKHPLHIVGDYERKLPDYPPEFCTHYEGFLRAVRGEMETLSPFSVGAPLTQVFNLAGIAQRLDRGFTFDPDKRCIIDDAEADALLRGPEPSAEWKCYYTV